MKTNKLLAPVVLALTLCTAQETPAKTPAKKIIGKWYNSRSYILSGEKKGFQFKRNGGCKALGIKTLELKNWEIKDNKLIINGFSISEDGQRKEYRSEEKIGKLNADTLSLVQCEKPIRLEFIYVNPKLLKQTTPSR